MKERPILFNDAMVRAIREGRKTQTRRPVKGSVTPHSGERLSYCVSSTDRKSRDAWFLGWPDAGGDTWTERGREVHVGPFRPPCEPGDRLWVRECYAEVHPCQAEGRYSQEGRAGIPGPPMVLDRVIYRADGPMPAPVRRISAFPYRELDPVATEHLPGEGGVWTPSIHMPRWASRLTLEVESVRIERLHEITEDGAKAEGFEPIGLGGPYQTDCFDDGTCLTAFNFAWGNIYGFEYERGDYGWDANPIVWVCTFKVVSQ